jgi:hypothetical protein
MGRPCVIRKRTRTCNSTGLYRLIAVDHGMRSSSTLTSSGAGSLSRWHQVSKYHWTPDVTLWLMLAGFSQERPAACATWPIAIARGPEHGRRSSSRGVAASFSAIRRRPGVTAAVTADLLSRPCGTAIRCSRATSCRSGQSLQATRACGKGDARRSTTRGGGHLGLQLS